MSINTRDNKKFGEILKGDRRIDSNNDAHWFLDILSRISQDTEKVTQLVNEKGVILLFVFFEAFS